MAYYIFLKSLRSLEEFRKNPHVKIPPKSPSTIFQSLVTIKNQILFRKEFFLHFRPNRPSARPIPACVAFAYLPKAVSSSSLRSPTTTPSPSVTATRARLSASSSPRAGRPRSEFLSVIAPSHHCPAPRMPPSFYSPPSSLSPLNPLQTER
jgi:hypothetical protein